MRGLLPVVFLWISVAAHAVTGPSFIANRNQWPASIHFAADVPQGRVLFMSDRIRFAFQTQRALHAAGHKTGTPHGHVADGGERTDGPVQGHIYDVRFVGGRAVLPEGENVLATYYNYFLGNDRSQWASRVPAYSGIRYRDVYCGIDMRYYGEGERMKYEWIVSPQAHPDSIRMAYDGVSALFIDNGRLHVQTSVNDVLELEPFAYQWKNGYKIQVPCLYALRGNEVIYTFPEGYDECYELIIDPILIFSAYSGSTLDNWGNTATYDDHGNVYSGGMVDGSTRVTGYPVTPGAYQVNYGGGRWDVGILKYDSAGTQLLYCTFLGGADTETPQSLVVNSSGDLLILGATGSSNFPVTNGSHFSGGDPIDPLGAIDYVNGTDLFVAKLSEDGATLHAATYLGGTKNDGVNFVSGDIDNGGPYVISPLAKNYGDQLRGDIITGAGDFVYLVSNTLSSDFPIAGTGTVFNGGNHDAVVVKLSPDLSSVLWSRFVGGTGTDSGYSIKLDDTENIFVAGGSDSPSIGGMNGYHITNQGGIDGWVMSFTNTGAVIDGTFIGTVAYDQCYFVDLDAEGDVFVYGQTMGRDSVTSGVYSNPQSGQFLKEFDHALKVPGFSTVIGTGGFNPNISPTAFLVSDCGYIYLGGWGGWINSLDANYVGGDTRKLPVTPNAYQPNTSGNDFYFMVLSADASEFLYGTFLGGNQSPTHVDGGTSRFDKRGIVYHAVCAGCGGFSDFPAVNVAPEHQFNRSARCNNAVFKFDLSLLKARLQTNSIQLDMPGLNTVCMPDKIAFQNFSSGGKEFVWDMGDGTVITKSDKSTIIHQYQATGRYTVWLKAIDPGTCQGKDSVSVVVTINTADAEIQDDDAMCFGTSYQLKASGGASYSWRSEDGTFTSNQATPQISPADTTVYYVTVTEATGCIHRDTVQINVIDLIVPDFTIARKADCFSTPSVSVENLTDSLREGDRLFFDFGDGTTADSETVAHAYKKDGQYTVKLVAVREFCVSEKAVTLPFMTLKIPNVITPGKKDGKNDVFDIQFGQQEGVTPGDYGYQVSLVMYNRWGSVVYKTDDYRYDWSGEGLAAGIYYYEVTVADHAHCKSWVQVIR